MRFFVGSCFNIRHEPAPEERPRFSFFSKNDELPAQSPRWTPSMNTLHSCPKISSKKLPDAPKANQQTSHPPSPHPLDLSLSGNNHLLLLYPLRDHCLQSLLHPLRDGPQMIVHLRRLRAEDQGADGVARQLNVGEAPQHVDVGVRHDHACPGRVFDRVSEGEQSFARIGPC